MHDLFVIPGSLAVTAGVLAYLFKSYWKRRTTAALMELEINLLLVQARENLDYLDRPSHHWLKTGTRLRSAPKAFPSGNRLFDSLAKDLHVLGRRNAIRVLAFYTHYTLCENLRRSLFERVAELKDAQQPLSDADVATLRARLDRCCEAFRHLDKGHPETITLRQLKAHYDMPSTQGVQQALQASAGNRPAAATPSPTTGGS